MHFWCRLFPMSTDGQAWSSGGEGQKDLDASCSLFRLRMIRCKDCSQLWRAQRERSGREKSPQQLMHPSPAQQLITGWLSRALSLCWHPPVWGLRGVTSVTMCSAFVLCGNKTVLHVSNLRIVVFISQCLMTPFCRSWSIDWTLNRFSTLSTLIPSEWFLIATLNDMLLMSCKSHVLVGWSRHKRSNTLRKT